MPNFDEIINGVKNNFSLDNDGKGPVDNKARNEKLKTLLTQLQVEGCEAVAASREAFERADSTYRAFRIPDKEDKKASERGEPIKIIYPVTYAQIQTQLAATIGVFNKVPYFELEGRGPNFVRNSKLMELELQYQFDHTNWVLIQYQWFMDMLKYGVGKINISFENVKSVLRVKNKLVEAMPILSFLGIPEASDQEVLTYQGNAFQVDDPYTLNFDQNVSVGDIQKGQYVFKQEVISRNEAKARELDGEYFNTSTIPTYMLTSNISQIGATPVQRPSQENRVPYYSNKPAIQGGDVIVIDECYIKLVPSDYGLSDCKRQQIWCIAMANESVIVKAEPSRYQHGMFPTAILEYSPDLHQNLNYGLCETIQGLQDLLNWLLNSHISNVRQVINNKLVVDPSGIEIKDLEERRNTIRMKPGKASLGIDRYIKQLQTTDVTQQHVADAMSTLQMIQRVTGISDNFQGMQLPTTRTATEVQSLQRLAAGRMKLLTQLMFSQGIKPLGEMMIKNTQQFMSTDRFLKVTAGRAIQLGIPPQLIESNMLHINPEDLAGQFQICMIDSNTPLDKQSMAAALQDLAATAMSAPQLISLLGVDLSQLFSAILSYRGITNTTDFINPPTPEAKAAVMEIIMRTTMGGAVKNGVTADVKPDEEVANQVKQGNLVPIG